MISFPANAARQAKQRRRLLRSHRLANANARAVSAVAVTGAVRVKVDSAETEGSVHEESGRRVETVAPVKAGRGHSVHKGRGPHANRENGQNGRRGRKENGQNERHVRHANRENGQNGRRGRKESDRPGNKESELHELSRHQKMQRHKGLRHLKQLLRRHQPWRQGQNSPAMQSQADNQSWKRQQKHQRHRRHRRCRQQRRLRASRGDSKPCYWHRHVQNTEDSIAVA